MDWVSILIIGLVIIAVGLLAYYVPSVRSKLVNILVSYLLKKEAWITLSVYNNLPPQIRKFLGSEVIAELVSTVIKYGISSISKK